MVLLSKTILSHAGPRTLVYRYSKGGMAASFRDYENFFNSKEHWLEIPTPAGMAWHGMAFAIEAHYRSAAMPKVIAWPY